MNLPYGTAIRLRDNSPMSERGRLTSYSRKPRLSRLPAVFHVPEHLRRRFRAVLRRHGSAWGRPIHMCTYNTEGTSERVSMGCPSIRRRIGARVARTKSIDQLN